VVAPPYDIIDSTLQKTLYDRHPNNVIRLELGYEQPGDTPASNKYTRAAGALNDWLKAGALRKDSQPSVYYHTIEYRPPYSAPGTPTKVFKGFLSTVELEEFGSGKIYPHENTRAAAKTDRLNLLEACRANFSAGDIMTSFGSPTLTLGNARATTNYMTSNDTDLRSMIILRSTSEIVDVPVDGTTYSVGNTIGQATVSCIDTTIATSTPDACPSVGLTNGAQYYFKIFGKDNYGNYSSYGLSASTLPSIPTASSTQIRVSSFRFRNDNGGESNASYSLNENASISNGFFVGDKMRLRFAISNEGTGTTTMSYGVDYATSSCTNWTPIPRPMDLTFEHFRLEPSQYIADNQVTSKSSGITAPSNKVFVPGAIQTFNASTPFLSLGPSHYTELEFSIRSTVNLVPYTSYCFRLSNSGDASNFIYSATPQIITSYAKEFRYKTGGGGGGGGAVGIIQIEAPSVTATTTVTGGVASSTEATSTEANTTPQTQQSTTTPTRRRGGGGDVGLFGENKSIFASRFNNFLTGMVLGETVSPMCVDMKSRMLYGSKDETTQGEVSQLQYYLKQKGYFNSKITGNFGKLTEEALKQFQKDNKLVPSGVAGKITRTTMKNLDCLLEK
jgi:hypothetical protein